MKKIILLLTVFCSLFFYYNLKTKINVTKVNNYPLYIFDTKEILDYFIDNDNIIYLTKTKDKYNLNQLDTIKNKNYLKQTFTEKCVLINNNILINNKLYNLDFSLKQTFPDTYTKIIPYQDTFINIENDILELLQKDNRVEFRKLPTNDYNYINYLYTDKNTYIYIQDNETKKYFVYDINSNKFQAYDNIYLYQNGYFYYKDKTMYIIDLINNTDFKYEINLELNNADYITINKSTLIIYKEGYISIINLEKKSIINEIKANLNIKNIAVSNNKVYFILKEGIGILYLDELYSKNIDIEDKNETNIYDEKKKLETEYNIRVHLKEETNIDFPDFYASDNKDNELIEKALISLRNVLKKYNSEFFNEFYKEKKDGLNFYFVGSLKPKDINSTIIPVAYSLFFENKYMIVLDINDDDLERVICHEIMHNIEINAKHQNFNFLKNWNDYNPKSFSYSDSYNVNPDSSYTLALEERENVYFANSYSKTYEAEDKAVIFENICGCDKDSPLKGYNNLYKKALYLKEEILLNYNNLKDSTLFNSLY